MRSFEVSLPEPWVPEGLERYWVGHTQGPPPQDLHLTLQGLNDTSEVPLLPSLYHGLHLLPNPWPLNSRLVLLQPDAPPPHLLGVYRPLYPSQIPCCFHWEPMPSIFHTDPQATESPATFPPIYKAIKSCQFYLLNSLKSTHFYLSSQLSPWTKSLPSQQQYLPWAPESQTFPSHQSIFPSSQRFLFKTHLAMFKSSEDFLWLIGEDQTPWGSETLCLIPACIHASPSPVPPHCAPITLASSHCKVYAVCSAWNVLSSFVQSTPACPSGLRKDPLPLRLGLGPIR